MLINYNFVCDKCGNTTYLEAENEYQKVLICEKCAECYVVEHKKDKVQPNTPKCPTCGSVNIEKISIGKKAFGGAMFGIFSSDVRNTMHCKNCGAKW